LFDYTDFGDTATGETLNEIGWSQSEFSLVKYWYFMDDNITTEAFQTLYAEQEAANGAVPLGDRLSSAAQTVQSLLSGTPMVRYGLWAAMAMAAAALLALLLAGERNPWPYAGVAGAAAGGWLLLLYLGYTGRLPMRAAMSVLLPTAAYLYCAFFAGPAAPLPKPGEETDAAQPPKRKPSGLLKAAGMGLTAAALAACIGMTALAVSAVTPSLVPPDEDEDNSSVVNLTDLDQYALENPDMLFIYELSLVTDSRLFPDTSEGVPDNVMFWGGYPARSPSWYRMLAKFGITELNASLFLQDNVLLVSTDAEPYQSLMGYLKDACGENVDWEFYDIYGYLYFMDFYTF